MPLSRLAMNPAATRLAIVVATLHMGFGAHLPFFGLWLAGKGLLATEIAIVLGAPLFLRVFGTPPLTALADRFGDPVRAIRLLSGLVAVLYASVPFLEGFWPILIVTLVAGLLWGTVAPLSDALVIGATREGLVDYGRVRMWGSLSFIVTASVMGLAIDRLGLWILPPVIVVAQIAMIFAVGRSTASARPGARSILDGARVLLRDPVLLLLLLGAACGHAAHGMFYTIGGVHWRSLGYSEAVIGFLWAVGVFAEIALFAVSTRILKRTGTIVLLAIGLVVGVVRWAVLAQDPALWFLFPWMTLHAGSFACLQAAGVQVMARRFPPELTASGQGTFFAIIGTLHGIAMIASGPLYEAFRGEAYLAMSVLCAAGLGLVAWAIRIEARRGTGGA